ncbi:hypothetical protein SCLCIDRAFT_133125 [Scleroderma citrinum Foug A]|uniref:Uncharacterized protein n=1 Tax=Scleroderma citrinum Foug A TaxID=1036808 RepID=A0A0C3DIT3_9AGAM|nr:hypothetical protein SCLCIDRAFT_133125 [Scleroderma citrinum Foug A]
MGHRASLKINDTHVHPQGFLLKLKNHVLGRLLANKGLGEEEFTQVQHNCLTFINNHIHQHHLLHINYTTYNLWQAQDSLNPSTHPDIMVLSHEDTENPHPYWYARIIGVFHAKVRYRGPEVQDPAPKRINFLWVQWFTHNKNIKASWSVHRLPCVGFYPQGESNAFSFVNPHNVIRGVHLIPAFCYGLTSELLPPTSIGHHESDNGKDWDWYFVNM